MSVEPNKKPFNKVLIIPAAIAAIVVLVAAFAINADIEERRAFEQVKTDLCDVYLDGFDVKLELCMPNPSSTDAKVDRIDVRVFAGDNNIAGVTIPKHITIPESEVVVVDADITIKKTGLLAAGLDYPFDKDVSLVVEGTVYYDSSFGTYEYHFSEQPNSSQRPNEASIRQQCSGAINDLLDYWGYALQDSSSKAEFEQMVLGNGYDFESRTLKIHEICDVRSWQGLTSASPHLDAQTKQRFVDFFSELNTMTGS